MTLLVAGLVLFIAVHLIPSVVPLRAALIARLAPGPYRGLFSLIAAADLVLIVWAFARAPFEPLYAAPAWGRQVADIMRRAGITGPMAPPRGLRYSYGVAAVTAGFPPTAIGAEAHNLISLVWNST